jgi:pyruvate/2-oxoglutarate dehydrogenase complex dihydrolipoamide acyltransferase (E2) component
MATAIAMPKLGMTMEEGRVVAWPVPLGGRVEKGRPVLVIESEKTEAEIEATASGVLRHIYVSVGETVACGTLLGAITATPDEPFDPLRFAALAAPPRAPRAGAERRPGPPVAPAPALASAASSPASPAARARARELGV